MQIDEQFVQSLLYEEESVELDAKRDQYRFVNATDAEKSELLKDILTFANAWRRSDAFIMIGVQEIKGGKNTVIGITELLDDANLQQFVNSKTQRPINFSYKNIPLEGKTIGLIHIPLQRRPFFLVKDYGKLVKEAVYVRRGTSTVIANPDEIAQMGISTTQIVGSPELEVFFSNPDNRTRLTALPDFSSLVLVTPDKESIPEYITKPRDPFGLSTLYVNENRNYYREWVSYTQISVLVSPVFLAITNLSEVTAHDVRLEIKIPGTSKGVIAMDGYEFPDVPKTETNLLESTRLSRMSQRYEITVEEVGTEWLAQAKIDKVQPKGTYWFKDPFYLGACISQDVELDIFLFADNLPEPHQQKLLVHIDAETRQVDLNGILSLERERLKSDPRYSHLIEEKEPPNE